MPNPDFAGKVVLVTGGAQGIGAAICQLFARHAATVVVADLQGELAQATATALRAQGLQASACQCDLAEPEQAAALVGRVLEQQGRLDVLIHNAAYFPLTAFADIHPPLLQRTLAVNLQALFWLSQAAQAAMRRQGADASSPPHR